MNNIIEKLRRIFLKKKPIDNEEKKTKTEEEKRDTFHEFITNSPQSVKKAFEYLDSEEFNSSKNSMIELNNNYYKVRDTVSKDIAEKIASFQNKVLVRYGFNVSATLKSAFDYGDRAIAKAELNDPFGAIEDFNKAIQLNSEYENAYVWRGEEKYKICDYQGAISDYHSALKLNSNNSETFLNLGKTKLKLGNVDEALLDLNKATALGNEKSEQVIKEFKENL